MGELRSRPETPRFSYPGLVRLELARSLRGGAAAATLALLLVLALGVGAHAPSWLSDGEGDRLAHGLLRQSLWSAALLFLLPVLVLRAAGTIPRWRRSAGDWLGSRPTVRTAVLTSTWLGGLLGAAGLLAIVALVSELRISSGHATLAYAGRFDAPARRLEPGERARFALPAAALDRSGAARLRVRVAPALGAEPRTTVTVRARSGAGESTVGPSPVLSRTWIELPLPAGSDRPGRGPQMPEAPLEIAVENLGPGALALLPGGLELWVPGGSDRRGSLDLALRALIALGPWLALAMALGAWVSAPTAGAAVLTAALLASTARVPNWLPGAGLVRALGFVGEGRLPVGLGAAPVLAATLGSALGIALARWGLRSWRPGP